MWRRITLYQSRLKPTLVSIIHIHVRTQNVGFYTTRCVSFFWVPTRYRSNCHPYIPLSLSLSLFLDVFRYPFAKNAGWNKKKWFQTANTPTLTHSLLLSLSLSLWMCFGILLQKPLDEIKKMVPNQTHLPSLTHFQILKPRTHLSLSLSLFHSF
jgi:hypothetical protein